LITYKGIDSNRTEIVPAGLQVKPVYDFL